MKFTISSFVLISSLLLLSCSGEKKTGQVPAQTAAGDTTAKQGTAQPTGAAASGTTQQTVTPAVVPAAEYAYVLDQGNHTIFEINLETNKVSNHFKRNGQLKSISYDVVNDLLYEGYAGANPGLKVFDPRAEEYKKEFTFGEPVTDMLFDPVAKNLYIISEDSTSFKMFQPDSMKIAFTFPMTLMKHTPVGPRTLMPGPQGKLMLANGPRASMSWMFPGAGYGYQTIANKEAKSIDYAIFCLDGNSGYCCDTKQGSLYKMQFNDGKILAEKNGLDHPRQIQLNLNGNIVVVPTGKTTLLMLNPDTFVETGKVDLSDSGDELLSILIPPKSNYAEVTMDYKGVMRWIRFDLQTWKPIRLVELI